MKLISLLFYLANNNGNSPDLADRIDLDSDDSNLGMYRNNIMQTLKQAHHINIITASVSPNQIGYIDKVSIK